LIFNNTYNTDPASFRDPNGFVFKFEGKIYRQVNQTYKNDYDFLMESGLYQQLVDEGLLLSHNEVVKIDAPKPNTAYKILKPEQLNFISYPYEWSFYHFRSAALTTIRIAKTALKFGMMLKDASAYNMQFYKGRWCLIDTLSFEIYPEGEPWIAYKQFCQHFLAPLCLMSYKDARLGVINRLLIDGVPLDLTSKLLPFRTKFHFGLLMHIHLHARSQRLHAKKPMKMNETNRNLSKKSLFNLLESLRTTVKSLRVRLDTTEWENYYEMTNYTDDAFVEKKKIVEQFIDEVNPESVWDMGANTGEFSRISSSKGIFTVAFDIDPNAVSNNYLMARKNGEINLLPLVMDLTNPSPSLGWGHEERKSLLERGPAKMVIALALIHHLAISNNVPLDRIAKFFSQIGKYLIIEFVPKSDSQVQLLLGSRKDIFTDYYVNDFEIILKRYYQIIKKKSITDSDRIIYMVKVLENE
jgi:hypothetical protein